MPADNPLRMSSPPELSARSPVPVAPGCRSRVDFAKTDDLQAAIVRRSRQVAGLRRTFQDPVISVASFLGDGCLILIPLVAWLLLTEAAASTLGAYWRRRFHHRLAAFTPAEQAETLLPLYDDEPGDLQSIVRPLIRQSPVAAREVIPASQAEGRGTEASPAP
jgi:hypothetical protein